MVEAKLELFWSPQQITDWLKTAYPEDPMMRVSHETIYLSLSVRSRSALSVGAAWCLRRGRVMRYPRAARHPSGRGRIVGMDSIYERPAEVTDRTVPGHGEGDLVLGRRPSAVATLIERTSRYTLLIALPGGFTAPAVRAALTDAVLALPRGQRRSLTWDQGKEMAEHAALTAETGLRVYFCDRRSPWQRGSNENLNGLLRQYLAKNADLASVRQTQLDSVADRLNDRPRRVLGGRTPAQVFTAAAFTSGVAFIL